MFGKLLLNVREKNPLVHSITNNVTVNDVANMTLALGASPIMADGNVDDATQITRICGGLNINIGTLNDITTKVMIEAGIESNKCNHPVVLDPVGIGASKYRTDFTKELLDNVKFTVIRGNISEIKSIATNSNSTRGVDASSADKVTDDNIDEVIEFSKKLAKNLDCIIGITGEIDIVCDSERAYILKNGNSMMSSVTGTGCQLSAMITAFVIANPDEKLEAVVAAVSTMGVAGEIAYSNMEKMDGNSTYRNRIIDAVFNMTEVQLDSGIKYETR